MLNIFKKIKNMVMMAETKKEENTKPESFKCGKCGQIIQYNDELKCPCEHEAEKEE